MPLKRLNTLKRHIGHLWPRTLFWQLAVVMFIGVLATHLVGNSLWAWQSKRSDLANGSRVAKQLAAVASNNVTYFAALPPSFRQVALNQLRDVGGARFFISINAQPIALNALRDSALQQVMFGEFDRHFSQQFGHQHQISSQFTWPNDLQVDDYGNHLADLPATWTQLSLMLEPKPAPVLVFQAPLDDQQWLLMATLLPEPYFLAQNRFFDGELWLAQLASLISLLGLGFIVVRRITKPLKLLAIAADNFGKGLVVDELPSPTCDEIAATSTAFTSMRERIQRYLDDRQKLFAAISHDLRTPITRLKLRCEFIDDDALEAKFHADIDELDLMVKGALQSVKDTAIHENKMTVDLANWLSKLADNFNIKQQLVRLNASPCTLSIKPLAMQRALSNLIDNGIKYGDKVDITLRRFSHNVEIQIRDFGPGVTEHELTTLFAPYVRFEHGKQRNQSGSGLGLSISQNIIQAHGGDIYAENNPAGGLVFTIILPHQ